MSRQTANAGARRRTGSAELFVSILNSFPRRRDAGSRASAGGESVPWHRRPLFRKLLFAFISLILAMLLWGYVLMSQNPSRTRTINNITPTFESGAEADLILKKLTVYGDIAEVLKSVDVTVSAPLRDISKITPKNITATISLSDVHSAGTYRAEVKAVSTVGRVVSVDPAYIDLQIDELMSGDFPVTYEFVGELPEGYWHDTPQLLNTTVNLEGAKSDLMNASNAVCYIDLNNLTESINRSIQLEVLDNEGNVIDGSVFKNIIPAANVQMTVLPHKHVPIIYEIVDKEQLPDVFEIQSESLTVTSLDIAAEPDVLETVESIGAEPVSIAGVTETGSHSFTLTLKGIPEGAYVLGGVNIDNIQLTLVIGERIVSQTFENLPIMFVGEHEYYTYTYGFKNVDVTVTGPARLMQSFVSSNLTVIVNVEGRPSGAYELELEYTLSDVETFGELEIELAEESVGVIIAIAEQNQ